MKQLIQKFIIRNWLKNFFLFFSILILIITIAEVVTGLLDNQKILAILLSYSYKLPSFLSKLLPINCLLASVFTISKQKSTSELTAILAGGFSQLKYISTILSVALIIAIIQFILISFIEPAVFKHKYSQEISLKMLKKEGRFLARSFLGEGQTWYKNESYFVSFTQYIAKTQTLKDLKLYYYKDGLLLKYILAPVAKFNHDKKSWDFKDAKIFDSLLKNQIHQYKKHQHLSVILKEVPDDFKTFETDIKTFHFFKLYRFIEKLKNTGIDTSSYAILLYEKIALSIICIIFAFFPLVTIINPNSRSSSNGKNIAFTLAFAIFYWLGHSTFLNLGAGQRLLPIIASFAMPTMVSIGLFFYWKRKN